jgi:urease subunit alpha
VSGLALEHGVGDRSRTARRFVAVRGCRTIGKRDMVRNDALPRITVDPRTYEVRADGELLTCEPATTLPLSQRYALF